jgi:ubiquinone/menaquinone biosynthesis C-methylase UbiE/uncharacterized protein YbaR (Trm112 family)
MSLRPELLAKLACPICGNTLIYNEFEGKLACPNDAATFAIEKNVPILIAAKEEKVVEGEKFSGHSFDYLEHYKTDAEEFDYFEERTGATEHSERRIREDIISKIPSSAESILDVGSGSAWLAKHFLGSDTFVCSMDATIINTSKALEKYPSPNHAAVVADAFHLPFKDHSFDCVVAAEIIEHVPDPKAFVHSLLRVIKPGGSLIISTPYKEVIKYALCIHCNQKTPLNAHLHSFDEAKLRKLFEGDEIKNFSWKAFNNKLLIFARTHVILKYFPHPLWEVIDRITNAVYKKELNIVIKVIR